GIIASLLNNNTAMDRAAAAIVTEAKLYQGVNLDFEGLGYQDEGEKLAAVRASFNRFVRLLAARLQAGGLNLTLTLHAPNSVYKGYDYRTLGELADRIIIMAYDYGSRPEPVNLVIQAVEMAGAAVPPDKLILGISVPNETQESIVAKVGIAKRYKLQGVALWRLGLVPAAMWDELRKMIK
ncbi:MAG: copper amine oxidase, partial [Moorella sp. (in: Bacteria)]|nr:copper amine oxidase [Moorella sp. (in: firmicutes)]